MTRTVLALLAVVASAGPARAQPDDRHTRSPYELDATLGNSAERAAAHEALAADAAATGDHDRRARHLVLACGWRALRAFDGRVAPCPEAEALAAKGPLDAQLMLEEAAAERAAWQVDRATAEAATRAIIARGAALDPTTIELRPVLHAWVVLGVILGDAGRFDEGLAALDQGLAAATQAGDLTMAGYMHWARCRAHQLLGDAPRAKAACGLARAEVERSGDWYLDLNTAFIEGEVAALGGRPDEALAAFERALTLARQPGGELRLVHAADAVASTAISLGRLAEARRTLETLEREAPAAIRATFRYLIDHQWGKLLRAEGDLVGAARAFAVSAAGPEADVAVWGWRNLGMVRRQQGDLAGAEDALVEAIARLEARRLGVSGAAPRATLVEEQVGLYSRLVAVLWQRHGGAAGGRALEVAEAGRVRALRDALAGAQVAGTAAPVLDAAALQAALGPEQALIEYVVIDDELFAITATRAAVTIAPLLAAATATELAARVDFFRQLVGEAPDQATIAGPGARLYADLLAPALAALPPEVTTLIIAPDGPLRDLPFDALMVNGAALLDRWQLAIVPGASALTARAAPAAPTASALVVAAPVVPGLAPLPAAPREADAVRRELGGRVTVLTGEGASEAALARVGIERYAVLHLASHAVNDPAMPLRSALILAPGGDEFDGQWRAEEIYRLALHADLVVLSACSTAAGQVTRGEGTLSLARAFLHAGAAATVSTLWDLEDAAGPAFAQALYRSLTHGASLGASVAAAKRGLAALGAPPRVWAAFVLTGSPSAVVRVPPPAPPRSRRGPLVALALAGLATLGLVLILRTRWKWLLAAGGSVAAVAVVLARVPRSEPTLAPRAWVAGASATVTARGGGVPAMTARASVGRVEWTTDPGVEYRVAPFTADGAPLPAIAAVSSPAALPAGAGWVRVDALRDGVVSARSAVLAVGPVER